MLPRSGGQYVFVRHALGGYAGFVVGWSDWISTCGSAALMAMVIGEYLGVLVPPRRRARWLAVAAGVCRFAIALLAGDQVGRSGPAVSEPAQGAGARSPRGRLLRAGRERRGPRQCNVPRARRSQPRSSSRCKA